MFFFVPAKRAAPKVERVALAQLRRGERNNKPNNRQTGHTLT